MQLGLVRGQRRPVGSSRLLGYCEFQATADVLAGHLLGIHLVEEVQCDFVLLPV